MWYKCKAKRIWDWSGMHFFGQSNSCCLPFTGSQNHSGALPERRCLDKCVCVYSVFSWLCALIPFSVCLYGCEPVWFCSHSCISMCMHEVSPSCPHLFSLSHCCKTTGCFSCGLMLLTWNQCLRLNVPAQHGTTLQEQRASFIFLAPVPSFD